MTFDSVSQDFAFESGATKSPRIQGRDSFLTPQLDFLFFAFRPFCEIESRYFAAGVASVGFGPSFVARPGRGALPL